MASEDGFEAAPEEGDEFGEVEELEAEEASRPRPLQLHDSLVVDSSGTIDSDYRILLFKSEASLGLFPQPIVLVATIQGKFLVAVPAASWSRATRDRQLPSQALSKVFSAQVLAASEDTRDQPSAGVYIKVWFGILKSEFEECIELDDASLPYPAFPSVSGESGLLPYAQSLVSVSDEKYAFLSAESNPPRTVPNQPAPKELESRVSQMEGQLQETASSLKLLIGGEKSSVSPQPVQAAEKPAEQPRPSAPRPPRFPGLDQSVVNAALQAGIGHAQLTELSKMVGVKKPQLRDSPMERAGPRVKFDVLGEPITEEQEDSGLAENLVASPPQDQVSAALVKLTSIVDSLSQKRRNANLLSEFSDDCVGLMDPSSSSSSGGARRHSAILAALRKSLRDHPEEISSVIEARMEKDVGSQEIAPGIGGPSATFRGWAEHRSRVPNINTSVRVMWSVCGALDCLRSGRVAEARCRLCLLVGQLDQLAIDKGQWILSSEGALEDPPPFSSFGRHSLPDMLEPQHTKLWPTPWAEALMWTVKERDEFLERKNKIGKRGNQKQFEDDEKGNPKGKKGKGKGRSTAPSSSASTEEKTSA